ncbi:MAG TPA: PH domain-containing protein [Alphaproteobacteria bacterium]|nr:PH domain-containing protein [Alphaproteobacteria bacterium]
MTDSTVARPPAKSSRPALPALVPGEEILATSRIHAGIYWKSVAVLILGFLLLFKVFNLGIMFLIVGAGMAAVAWVMRTNLMLVLTNRRVVVRQGLLFWTEGVELRLSQIESVELEKMIPGMVMGYGTVAIAGTGQRTARVPYVANAERLRRAIDEILLKREAEKT